MIVDKFSLQEKIWFHLVFDKVLLGVEIYPHEFSKDERICCSMNL